MGKVEHQEQMRREGWGVTKEGNTQGTDNGGGGGGAPRTGPLLSFLSLNSMILIVIMQICCITLYLQLKYTY